MDRDLELLQRWRDGEAGAGNQLFKRHFDSLWRFFDNKLDGDVDELVQATFLACVRSRDRFKGQSSFRTYVFVIARNELYRHLRKRKRDADALDFGVTSLADLRTTPGSWLARKKDCQLLLHALQELPVEQQIVLELHYWEDMTPTELAAMFEITPSAMRSRLLRARESLRELVTRLADQQLGDIDAGAGGFDAWARSLREGGPSGDPSGGQIDESDRGAADDSGTTS